MGSKNFSTDRGIPHLLRDLENLMEDQTSDLVFFVGPQETPIRCHSILIRNRCKHFRPESSSLRCPELSPDIFRAFLRYVYTGKLSVEENSVFDLLCLSEEMGMEDLEKTCEDLLCSHLEPMSAFPLLTSALKASNRPNGFIKKKIGQGQGGSGSGRGFNNGKLSNSSSNTWTGLNRLINLCVSLIGENPMEGLHSSQFLAIPTETLTAIISSDHLCLEEEEVWRAVLRWAQFQSGVETHLSCWTDEERSKVAKFLTPVISHVRLLLIDSRVFAEEVEPTGCVPMALSLERYRFAALPNQCVHHGDPRLTPRISPRLFQNSTIVTSELGKKLNEWYLETGLTQVNLPGSTLKPSNKPQSWKCIYRASIHGFSSEAFHNHCDGIAPTYVLAQIQDTKWICGGFSDVPWARSKTPRYATSTNAFLFCFDRNNHNGSTACKSLQQPTKFNLVKKHFAICHDSYTGPVFGAGADLYISSNCNQNSDSYSNLPHSYGGDVGGIENLEASVLTPSYNFIIEDYEVFVPLAVQESS